MRPGSRPVTTSSCCASRTRPAGRLGSGSSPCGSPEATLGPPHSSKVGPWGPAARVLERRLHLAEHLVEECDLRGVGGGAPRLLEVGDRGVVPALVEAADAGHLEKLGIRGPRGEALLEAGE